MQLRDNLDAATLPAHVAAFPDRARQLVRQVGERIVQEANKKQRTPAGGAGQFENKVSQATRPLRSLRTADVAAVTRVTSVQEWEQLSTKLDRRVRQLLADGYDVQLE